MAQAVAKAVPAPFGAGKRLVGYVTPASVDPAAAIAHCRASLIPAMVPSVVVALEAFPLLPNGKTDANSLPAPDWERTSEEEYVEPENDLERALQRIWMKVGCWKTVFGSQLCSSCLGAACRARHASFVCHSICSWHAGGHAALVLLLLLPCKCVPSANHMRLALASCSSGAAH